jgi:predicted  nucleic acid-binding Zn-ribbon protein
MNNEKLKKIETEIVKVKAKISEFTARLRELERQKTETENAGIIALVRDMDILPDELTAFIQAYKTGTAVMPPTDGEITHKEDTDEQEQ